MDEAIQRPRRGQVGGHTGDRAHPGQHDREELPGQPRPGDQARHCDHSQRQRRRAPSASDQLCQDQRPLEELDGGGQAQRGPRGQPAGGIAHQPECAEQQQQKVDLAQREVLGDGVVARGQHHAGQPALPPPDAEHQPAEGQACGQGNQLTDHDQLWPSRGGDRGERLQCPGQQRQVYVAAAARLVDTVHVEAVEVRVDAGLEVAGRLQVIGEVHRQGALPGGDSYEREARQDGQRGEHHQQGAESRVGQRGLEPELA